MNEYEVGLDVDGEYHIIDVEAENTNQAAINAMDSYEEEYGRDYIQIEIKEVNEL